MGPLVGYSTIAPTPGLVVVFILVATICRVVDSIQAGRDQPQQERDQIRPPSGTARDGIIPAHERRG